MKKIFAITSILVFLFLLAGCATPLHTASGDGDTKTVLSYWTKENMT